MVALAAMISLLVIQALLVPLAAQAPAPSPLSPSSDEVPLLLQFKQSLSNSTALSGWDPSSGPPCGAIRWPGVICDANQVWGLQLENMGLEGPVDVDSLALLPKLRSLSLTNNSFAGPLPPLGRIPWLKSLFLAGNRFSGPIDPDFFSGMGLLKKVYLSRNDFTGGVPPSLSQLPKLLEVGLDANSFQGRIPEFASPDLRFLNLSFNALDGPIPPTLNGFNSSSFFGNPGLCGEPLGIVCKRPSSSRVVLIVVIAITLGLVLLISIVFLIKRNRQVPPQTRELSPDNKAAPAVYHRTRQDDKYGGGGVLERPSSYRKSDNGKLCFLKNERGDKFEMQDLLRASAEVLGSGSFGSSYKAALPTGPVMVVKRFRQMNNVGKEEFQEHLKKLGRLRHQNLLPLVAYFHKRDEKLLISEYVENGSLASHLHSNRTAGEPGLSWPLRLKIVKGVARGLAYLYRELSSHLALPHGHLKSSNILVDDAFEALLCDYSLSPLINKDHAEQVMAAYKSPEFTIHNRTTKKTDVWCLGILILEILTGKFPANYLKHGKGGSDDLETWVSSVVKGESTVFDSDMGGTANAHGEMLKLLKIGMWCCEWNDDKRWTLREAVEKIEELKERDSGDSFPEPEGSITLTAQDRLSFR